MNTKIGQIMFSILIAALLALTPVFGAAQPARAEAIPCLVTSNLNDGSTGTLRSWLADSSCATITFLDNYTIPLASTLTIDRNVTIDGAGYTVTVSGDVTGDGMSLDDVRVFTVNSGVIANLQNLTVAYGFANVEGGGIYNSGTLTVTDSVFANNFAINSGGAIYNKSGAVLTLTRVAFNNNQVSNWSGGSAGGGIYNGGTLTVTNSSFTGNKDLVSIAGAIMNATGGTAAITGSSFDSNVAPFGGGALANFGSTMTVDNSSFTGNSNPSGYAGGGAIWNSAGNLTVTNSVFSGNTSGTDGAPYSGLGGAISSGADLSLTNNTFTGNSALINREDTIAFGGAVFVSANTVSFTFNLTNNTFSANTAPNGGALYYDQANGGSLTANLYNNILVKGATGGNCFTSVAPTVTASNNLTDDDTCGTGFTNSSSILLGTLGNYGGLTQTIPLLTGSSAIDAGDDASCPATDQRGVTRPQGAHCDIGAYEYQPPVTSTFSISGQLFYDDNGNGIWDAGEEASYFGETVQLDQGCDGIVDSSFLLTYYVQTYTFASLPADQSYCVSYYNPGYRTTTPKQVTDSLSSDLTGVNIGYVFVTLEASESAPLNGPVNVSYNRTITVTGGDAPYTFAQIDQALPAGLTAEYNSNAGTITVSGTPTQAGKYSFTVDVTDGNGATLVKPIEYWIQTDANFSFTSSPNPATVGQEVTFSLGIAPDDQFGGTAVFYADGTAIEGCTELFLVEMETWGGTYKVNPVVCTTSALTVGQHAITATYTPLYGAYQSAAVTLTGGQTVNPTVLQASVTLDGLVQTYDGGPKPITVSTDPAGLTVDVTYDGSATVPTDAGSYAVLATVNAPGYQGTEAGTLVVSPRPITVTADAQSKVAGAPDPALTYRITSGSLIAGDSFSGELIREPGETAGTYAITLGALSAGNNYSITFVPSELTITAKEYNLAVTTSGNGTVAKSPDQPKYLSGSSVQLTATPAVGWSFAGWSGDASGSANPLNVTMDGDKNITATFVDVTRPNTQITSFPPNPSYNNSATFTFTGTDNATPSSSLMFECKLDGGAWATCSSPKMYSGLTNSSHTFSVRAKDAAGNVDATPAYYTWTVKSNRPPVADAGGPYYGNEGTSIYLSAAKSTDHENNIVLYEWDLDNDGLFDDATGKTPKFAALDNGVFTVRVRVTDAGGLSSVDDATVTVRNVPPVILSFTITSNVHVGDTVNARVTFKDAGIYDTFTVVWNWGDGTTTSGSISNYAVTGSHVYTQKGDYTVTITITDKDGGVVHAHKVVTVSRR
jgi:hypothetical protein